MDEEKGPVEKMMARDCIILSAVNEVLAAMSKPSINTKCRGPACAQYSIFTNFCGLAK